MPVLLICAFLFFFIFDKKNNIQEKSKHILTLSFFKRELNVFVLQAKAMV